ncbi:GerMN domain-containing protein [Blautia sp. MSJ-19]|uniref:GerMN domain-containing protein n=1 Tax=Blautia sp. MSJ-19 TaxID=2841517 RepID=UPI001C0F1E58|nr:GerMN domain-containing protein [Blautia sp. MSJ-19]MBU5481021.1 GerMN domain-containing protein [Blautia sp. MSJ-19]
MKKYIRVLLLAALVCSLLAGCSIETKSNKTSQEDSKYHLYYMNESETALKEAPYSPEEDSTDFMVKDLMQKLGSKEAPDGDVSLLPEDVSINSYEVQKDLLVIDFSDEYSSMSKIREVMTRAGIVQTFLQISDIRKVQFTVAGQALKNSRNQEIGEMTSDTFAQYSGKDTESYRYDTFTLYFTDKSGKNLVKETRNVYYRRSLPKERVVLEQLAKGPMEDGHYPTIPQSSLVLSVITADKICYMDLNNAFQSGATEVGENISIYSVVNSIADSCDVDRVQISIEGSTEGNFQDSLPLYKFYEKNEDLIAQEKEES